MKILHASIWDKLESSLASSNDSFSITSFHYLKYVLLIFIEADLILTGSPPTVQVSHRTPVSSILPVNRWTPLRFARPHWLNHQPVFSLKLLQLFIGSSWREHSGWQPSLSISYVLKGNEFWLSSFLSPRNASPEQRGKSNNSDSINLNTLQGIVHQNITTEPWPFSEARYSRMLKPCLATKSIRKHKAEPGDYSEHRWNRLFLK